MADNTLQAEVQKSVSASLLDIARDTAEALEGVDAASAFNANEMAKSDLAFARIQVAKEYAAKHPEPGMDYKELVNLTAANIPVDEKAAYNPDQLEQKRNDQSTQHVSSLQAVAADTLKTFTEAEPETKEEIFSSLVGQFKRLKGAISAAKDTGRNFGMAVFNDPSSDKYNMATRVNLGIAARTAELQLTGNLGAAEAELQAREEFKEITDAMAEDPELMAAKLVWESQEGQEVLDPQAIAIPGEVKRTRPLGVWDPWLALAADFGISMIPRVGALVGGYMAWTGDDLVMNYLLDDERKLAWWERGLVAIPVVHSLWKGVKGLPRAVARTLELRFGTVAMRHMMKQGPEHVVAALKRMKQMGDPQYQDLVRQFNQGLIEITESDEVLAQILRGIEHPNKGAGRVIVQAATKQQPESMLATLARTATIKGDDAAKQAVYEMVAALGDDTSKNVANLALDALGSDSLAAETIVRNFSTVENAEELAVSLNKRVVEARRKAEIARKRLMNLQKARDAKAAKRAKALAKAEKAEQLEDIVEEPITKADEAVTVEEKAAEAPQLEEEAVTDTKIEDAEVGDSVPDEAGNHSVVVEKTETEVTTMDPDGGVTTVVKELTNEQKLSIYKQVVRLDSLAKVKKLFPGDDPISKYARLQAEKIFSSKLTETGRTVKSALKVSKARKQYLALLARVQKGDTSAFQEMKELSKQIDADIIDFPTLSSLEARQTLSREMKQTLNTLENSIVNPVKPKAPRVKAVDKLLEITDGGEAIRKATKARDLVDWVVKHGNKEQRLLAMKLRDHIPHDFPYQFDPALLESGKVTTKGGKATLMRLGPKAEKVPINTVLHEALHIATHEKLGDIRKAVLKGTATAEQIAISRKLGDSQEALLRWMQYAVKEDQVIKIKTKGEKVYGISAEDLLKDLQGRDVLLKVDELVAYAFTHPEIRALFNQVNVPHSSETVWSTFMGVMKKLFGIKEDTVLEKIFAATDELLPPKVKGAKPKNLPKANSGRKAPSNGTE